MNNINVKRMMFEIKQAERIFGKTNVFWDKNYTWVMIKKFNLPGNYNQKFTNCLILIPSGYGYGTPLAEFYVNKDLRVKNNGHYTNIPHYFQDNVHKGKSLFDKDWQWLCILPEWSEGDNLLTFIKQVEIFLKYPFENSMQ